MTIPRLLDFNFGGRKTILVFMANVLKVLQESTNKAKKANEI